MAHEDVRLYLSIAWSMWICFIGHAHVQILSDRVLQCRGEFHGLSPVDGVVGHDDSRVLFGLLVVERSNQGECQDHFRRIGLFRMDQTLSIDDLNDEFPSLVVVPHGEMHAALFAVRSEERRVGKEC